MKKILLTVLAIIGGFVVALFLITILAGIFLGGERAVPDRVVLELNLEQPLMETMPDDPLAQLALRDKQALRDITDALQAARTDKRVLGLVARIGTAPLGMAQIQELRDAISAFRATGKFAIAYAETFGEAGSGNHGYYLASAFEEILLQPSGDVGLVGLRAESMFVRGLLDKLGVIPRMDHRKEYKNAMNMLTETRYTAAHREATQAIIDSAFSQIVRGIAHGRGLEEARVRALIDRGPFLGPQALEAGLVDALAYRDEVLTRVGARTGDKAELLFANHYLRRAGRPHQTGRNAVALIYGVGAVTRGTSNYDAGFGGVTMGSDTVAAAFRAAVEDEDVKAIVFRIDSPGGSYVASDTIWRETVRAREAGKPVIASMGNVAGSGGYFVAMAADKIVAQPATITGSIGVLAGKALTSGLWDKLGISWDAVQTSANANLWSGLSDYSPAQWQQFQGWLDRIYEDFTGKVANGRKLPLEEVLKVAKGRVWTGEDAKAHGLVDELGGMETALRLARQAAGLPEDEAVRLQLYPKPRTLLEALTGEGPERSGTLPEAALAEALAVIEPMAQLLTQTGLRRPAGVLMMQGPGAGL